jgi:L-asparaginase
LWQQGLFARIEEIVDCGVRILKLIRRAPRAVKMKPRAIFVLQRNVRVHLSVPSCITKFSHNPFLQTNSPSAPAIMFKLRRMVSFHFDDDDSVHREGSVNPAILKVTESYKCFDEITPKVLVLFCGGTLIMRENDDGSLVVNNKDVAIELLLNMEPKIHEIAKLDVHFINNIDSSNMSPETWDEIGEVIHGNYKVYDGFVITHGTDTMAYTASALSFVLGDIGKPVIITGAQIPGSRIETDARRNFVNAVRVATLNKAGVMLVFDGDIILGARAHKVSESKLDAFAPVNWGLLGEVRIDIRFNDEARDRHNRPLLFQPGFEKEIAVLTLFPGFPPKSIVSVIESGVKALILNGYGVRPIEK